MALESLLENWRIWFLLLVIVVALVLFFTEIIPLEITALSLPVVLVVSGILDPLAAFSGFSNTATLTVLMMFILSAAILQSGLIDWLGERLGILIGKPLPVLLLVIGVVAGLVSAFINNTAAVAVLIPLVVQMANRSGMSPSKLLMPVSFAAMLGGTMTLIGTSTNLLASSLKREAGMEPLGMFEFSHAGFMLFILGMAYLVVTTKWLVPERVEARTPDQRFHLREFIFEAEVPKNSALILKPVGQADLVKEYEAEVLQLYRGKTSYRPGPKDLLYEAGDRLLVSATRANLQRMVDTGIVEILPTRGADPFGELEDFGFSELLVHHDSAVRGKRLGSLDLWVKHRVQVVALLSKGRPHTSRIYHRRLHVGDVLLVVGPRREVELLTGGDEFHVLGGPPVPLRRPQKIPLTLAIMAGVVGLAALGILPILVTATAGAVLMVSLGILNLEEMYRNIHWDVIILLAGIIPLGIAMVETGAAAFAASFLVGAAGVLPPLVLLGLVYLLTVLLTNVVSNNASVVLVIPVAIEMASQLGLDPVPFLLAAMFAASNAYLTPVGYQTNLMVMGPGGYRYGDFLRSGLGLTLLMVVATPLVLNMFWPVT